MEIFLRSMSNETLSHVCSNNSYTLKMPPSRKVILSIQGAYKLSEYFAKPYFHKYWKEIHDVTTIWKRNVCSFILTTRSILQSESALNHHKSVTSPNSRTHQLRSVCEAAISLQHWFTFFSRDGSSDYRTISNVTFTVCNRHEFHNLVTLPTQVMVYRNPPIIYTHPVLLF
jgi:hypothetical protein